MLPAAFVPFFTAGVGAAGALIGLLFIAISIAPERTVGKAASPDRAALAGNAFTALSNVFFISLVALIPLPIFSQGLIALGTFALVATLRLAITLLRSRGKSARMTVSQVIRRLSLVVISLGVYGTEVWQGTQLVVSGQHDAVAFSTPAFLIIATYGLALVRMWSLLGARRDSLLGWLSVLTDLDE